MNKASAAVACQIQSIGTGEGMRLEAVITAAGPVKGTYSFTLRRSKSAVPEVQSGDFEIASAGQSEVKKASAELAPNESYSASLDVRWPGGASSCSAAGS
jgi:hypothetical protein